MRNRVRVYHFLNTQCALDDLRNSRLKIARFDDLNDPFELWAIAQPTIQLRKAMQNTKRELAGRFGLLCFSLNWNNPLLWSHYGDRHRGIALGFDVPSEKVVPVKYVTERPVLESINQQVAKELTSTKYIDWQYEQEARMFTSLQDRDRDSGFYFVSFGEDCILREVIVGPLCKVTQAELKQCLGKGQQSVRLKKARLAFNSFKIVKNKLGLY